MLILMIFCFYFFLHFYFLVDIIKPKPLPRNVLNGHSLHSQNSIGSNNTNSVSQTITSTIASKSSTTKESTATSNGNNNTESTLISSTAPPMTTTTTTSAASKTESLIQRFSINSSSNGKTTPEVFRRISNKQIATIFEVRFNA